MTQNKAVFIKEIHSAFDRNNAAYTWVLDAENVRWNLFRINDKLEVNKGYVFVYETEGQFHNVKEIMPLVNIFQQKALREVANRNDIVRNYSIAVTQAIQALSGKGKDFAIGDMFIWAEAIYNYVDKKATELMPKDIENGK